MNKNLKVLVALFFVVFMMTSNFAFSQVKNFKLNSNVAPSSITFFSKTPIEDISGNLETDKFSSSIIFDASNPASAKGNVSLEVKGTEDKLGESIKCDFKLFYCHK